MTGVEISGVGKAYGATRILDGVTAGFEAGRLTSLLGPSGSGKTTLLRIIAGFVTPDQGTVRIGEIDVTRDPAWKRRIGMVFQSYALFPHMNVRENVVFGLHRRGIRGAEADAAVSAVLDLVRLQSFEKRRPKELSGGQQQRVALARAIVTRPKVLLLDEPLSALDRRLRQEMQVELRRIQRESGLTTIFVTHDQEEALTLSDRIAILDRGRVVQEGPPAEIYERPRSRFAASFLGDANFLEGRATAEGVETAGGLIRTNGTLPSPGSTTTLAIRPEKMMLLPVEGSVPVPEQNRIAARVSEVIYAGASSTWLLEGPDGGSLKVFAQNRESVPFAPGSEVHLAWARHHTVIVEG